MIYDALLHDSHAQIDKPLGFIVVRKLQLLLELHSTRCFSTPSLGREFTILKLEQDFTYISLRREIVGTEQVENQPISWMSLAGKSVFHIWGIYARMEDFFRESEFDGRARSHFTFSAALMFGAMPSKDLYFDFLVALPHLPVGQPCRPR